MLDSQEIWKVDLSKKMSALGAKGGKSTWAKMTPEQKTARAHKMLMAREAKRKAKNESK